MSAALDLADARPPVTWLVQDTEPTAFRACWRCGHGADNEAGVRVCGHPELEGHPVARARAWGGGCGPDAKFLDDPRIA